jgi:succinate-semialdehyde dehydrogenase/glutarate-semialdehyde dehydrogenase
MSCQSVNPYNGKLLKTFDHLNDKQVETALEGAAVCFEKWGIGMHSTDERNHP